MKTVLLYNRPYFVPEKAGYGLGLNFFAQLLAIYRRDSPGPSKLDQNELLPFLERMPKIVLTSEAAIKMLLVTLIPGKGSPSAESALNFATREEVEEACGAVSPLIDDLLGKDMEIYLDAISSVPAGFCAQAVGLLTGDIDDVTKEGEDIAEEDGTEPIVEADSVAGPEVSTEVEATAEVE